VTTTAILRVLDLGSTWSTTVAVAWITENFGTVGLASVLMLLVGAMAAFGVSMHLRDQREQYARDRRFRTRSPEAAVGAE
jgi:hypothetical protein